MDNFLVSDNTLGVSSQAWAVFYGLKSRGIEMPSNFRCHNKAWYNGRENSMVLSIYAFPLDRQLNVVFGECRHSDSLVVDVWESKGVVNPPTWQDKGYEEAYSNRKSFPCLNVNGACDYIVDRTTSFRENCCLEIDEREKTK